MAIVQLNSALRSIRGRIGDVVFKTYPDKIVMTRVPRFDGYVPTAAQRDRRACLRAATAYAKSVYADPEAKAGLVARAKKLGRQPFRVAISEYLQGEATTLTSPPAAAAPIKVPVRRRRCGGRSD